MNDRRSRHLQLSRWLSLAGALLLSTGLSGARGEPQENRTERYSALAVSVESPNESGSIPITIIIDRFTTDAEMKSYAETFRTGGVGKLRRRLENVKVGRVAPSGRVGIDVAIAREVDTAAGRTIRLVTARHMSFLELRRGERSTDYPFSWVELTLDKEGRGQGTAFLAFKPKFTKDDTLEIESLGNQPLRLLNVRREK